MSKQIIHEGLPVTAGVDDLGISGPLPNILVISTDQMRADVLGINGHPIVQTPHIDQLALSGINFRGAMSECPVCCPARRVLMTGRDPFGVEMFYNRDLQPFPQGPKLAELLAGAGYQCHGVGKMHVWPPRLRMGFHDIELNEEGRTAGHVYPDDYTQFLLDEGLGHVANAHGLGNNQYGYRPSPVPEHATSTGWTADRAMRFLRRRDPACPFFLYVSFDRPHPPATPPAEYYDLYRDVTFPAPVIGDWVDAKPLSRRAAMYQSANWEQWSGRPDVTQQWLRGYAAMCTHIDARIGQLLGTLRETQVLANTWILFVADHGDHCMDHRLLAKGDFFVGSCGIPFLVAPADTWMGRVRHETISTVDHHPVGLQDVLPTLCDLAGVAPPDDIPGRSLLPHFTNEDVRWRDVLCGVVGSAFAAQDGRHKYCWMGDDGSEFLFDLIDDPKDCHDLADDPAHADTRARLRAALYAWLRANGDAHAGADDLTTVMVEKSGEGVGHRASHWNNRGWR
jgi:arylsulfatase A-like enzyme